MNLMPLVALWAVMAVVVLVLAGIRMLSAAREDDSIHLRESDTSVIQHQAAYAGKIEWMDRWGKTLTIVTVSFGLVLASVYLYQEWVESTKLVS